MGTRSSRVGALLAYLFLFVVVVSQFCTSIDTITRNQSITEGQVLTSRGGIFELGFFQPSNSSMIYVGIWHKGVSLRKVVWVANREKPLLNSSAILTISSNGNLVILDGNGNTIWTTNTTSISSVNSVAVLLDSGNLVLRESNQEGKALWESFNYPSDTLLPTMKIGLNLKTGVRNILTSWKSEDDPSPGNFIAGLNPQKPFQLFLWNLNSNGTIVPYLRSGQWNGRNFIGTEGMDTVYFNGYDLITDDQEGKAYLTFSTLNSSLITFLSINASGSVKHLSWDEVRKEWVVIYESPLSRCEIYGTCGPNSSCNKFHSPICGCLEGYEPKSFEEWSNGNWRDGCVRRTQLQCGKNTTNSDGFYKLRGMKLPDFSEPMDIADAKRCELQCLRNCSCVGYAYVSGLLCMFWSKKLMDVQQFSVGGEDLFLRLANSELRKKAPIKKLFIIILIIGSGISSLCVLGYLFFKRKANRRRTLRRPKGILVDLVNNKDSPNANMLKDGRSEGEAPELQLFDLASIVTATNNFCLTNKLGQGGFGPVYKGKLKNGQEIAVKRLSKTSGQGIEEFKNELILISKFQHRNLVKLFGCCIEGEESMLLYEYMANKSLDTFLFDPRKRAQLDWKLRFNIIKGIARGLLYLHRDSRLRIIHRDLKVSNILLDEEMNPKISDFGMERIIVGKQTVANTDRVVGTFGYMPPEYIIGGRFSEKSDVFSFGVLMLEIVSSKRNNSFYHLEQSSNLLVHTWRLWKEGKWSEIVDEALADSYSPLEVMICIHIGLLCVQEREIDRPTMSTVDLMLSTETSRPPPKEPPFTSETSAQFLDFMQNVCTNHVTITMVDGR